MRENYTLTRLFIDAPLIAGGTLDVPKTQAHYLGTVLRKSTGECVRVFNDHDGEWQAEIAGLSRKGGTLRITTQVRKPYTVPDVTLCFAPVRKHRTAFIFEKATELGVARFQPVITARTQFPKLNQAKARLQVIEAAEQTERLDVPEILTPCKLEAFLEGWSESYPLIFADEAGDARAAGEVLRGITAPLGLLVGPEGGFTPTEREQLRAHTAVVPVTLGPRILRADTAALSLLTLWQAGAGDW